MGFRKCQLMNDFTRCIYWYCIYGLGLKGVPAIPGFLAVLTSEDLLAPGTASASASPAVPAGAGDALLDFTGEAPPPTDFSKEVESWYANVCNQNE